MPESSETKSVEITPTQRKRKWGCCGVLVLCLVLFVGFAWWISPVVTHFFTFHREIARQRDPIIAEALLDKCSALLRKIEVSGQFSSDAPQENIYMTDSYDANGTLLYKSQFPGITSPGIEEIKDSFGPFRDAPYFGIVREKNGSYNFNIIFGGHIDSNYDIRGNPAGKMQLDYSWGGGHLLTIEKDYADPNHPKLLRLWERYSSE